MSRGKYINYLSSIDAVSYVVSVEVRDANMLMRTYYLRISVPLGNNRNLVYITIGGGHTYEFDIPATKGLMPTGR